MKSKSLYRCCFCQGKLSFDMHFEAIEAICLSWQAVTRCGVLAVSIQSTAFLVILMAYSVYVSYMNCQPFLAEA